ncbi:glutathione S-transferase family protein [Paracoccus denitrificans]|jgi:glutathione S-transferase|uniref:Glutathione S-transferase, N-terminal domain n=1 Tax=Paracoccus denitrificans (strain Pd 1222) TaxID=318586 RepID=A1B609_PARDP|nr:glutathione S-transferase [Paracoccus denitrificans]ABL70953.1 Glutathione S-transferase, N-terminal domain [Paracoccus denitrificans PD1222]MBB4626608.1 glutathione S-transferase [Paracoccus denitrificans]MCU7428749.1 glutathione binding-like protein [Paracoccus denitrificans]QAR27631.1 glutathione S-transferase [Paracoccus denitrificans]UPV97319.1 glutathione binding-like protein [Paracoccus denitrificans]
MTAQLHCFGESGHSYKVALMMQLTGHPWQPVFVDFFGGATRGAEYRQLNEMGEAPVFVEDGLTLTQSGVILLHLAEQTGRFMDGDQGEILRWLFWDNHKGSSQFGALRFLMNFLPPEKRPAEVIAWLQGRCKAALKTLDGHLAARGWLAGDQATIADLSCCSYLYYPEPFGFDRAEWPHIDAWLSRIQALPGWKHPYDLMPGNPADRAAKEDA